MKIELSVLDLLFAATTAAKAASKKSPMDVLMCLRITGGERVSVYATNLQVSVESYISQATEPFDVGIEAEPFIGVLSGMSGKVTLESDGKNLSIQSGKSKSRLPVMASDNFVTSDVPPQEVAVLSAETLKLIAKRVLSFAARSKDGDALGGLHVTHKNGRIVFFGADGYRMSRFAGEEIKAEFEPFTVPSAAMITAINAVNAKEASLRYDGKGKAALVWDAGSATVAIVSGKYPDIDAVIGTEFTSACTFVSGAMANSLKMFSFIDSVGGIQLMPAESGIVLSASSGTGDVETEVDAEIGRWGEAFSLQRGYLEDAIASCGNGVIEIARPKNKGILFRIKDDADYYHVAMPMRA